MKREDIDINPDVRATLWEMERSNKCLFITGKAGTGKSTVLRFFRDHTKKKIVVLAPTGIAALNIGGQTIHSFFGFPPRPLQRKEIQVRRNRKIYQAIDMIIIDEVSMVRADLMDNIDYFMRLNGKDSTLPFGGVQMVFFGDLFQLPPVIASDEERILFQTEFESPYFFSARIFDKLPIQMIELREVYRQANRHFIKLLDAVRTNQIDYDEFYELNDRYQPDFDDDDFYVILSARNAKVDEINKDRLEQLHTEEFSYIANISGAVNVLPAETPLKLKLGAQVMFLKNDQKRRYVNGTIGKVVDLTEESIKVQILTPDGQLKNIDVERFEWELHKHELTNTNEIETKSIGKFTQFPLRLAWAMTIHKSQGKTFDRVIIDMGKGAFEFGQTYVALSRCTSLEGIVLKRELKPQDIMTDERIVQFYEQHF